MAIVKQTVPNQIKEVEEQLFAFMPILVHVKVLTPSIAIFC